MAKVVIVYHSGYGHTAMQADAVAEGAKAVSGTDVLTVKVEHVEEFWEEFEDASAIIFGAPTYMGSASGPFKTFMDQSSKIWMQGGWRDKLAAGFTNSGSYSGDKLNTLVQLTVFAAQHGMIWVSLGLPPGNNSSTGSAEDLNRIGSFLGAMAQSNMDQGPEVAPPKSDLETAKHLGQRVAELASRWLDASHS